MARIVGVRQRAETGDSEDVEAGGVDCSENAVIGIDMLLD